MTVTRRSHVTDALVVALVAMLGWPWSLALPATDSGVTGTLERTPLHFRSKKPNRTSRAASANRWAVTTPAAFRESDDVEDEDGADGGLGTSHAGLDSFAPPARGFPPLDSGLFPSARQRRHALSLERLCRLRC